MVLGSKGAGKVASGGVSGVVGRGGSGAVEKRGSESRPKAYTAMPAVELVLLVLLVVCIIWTFAVVLRDPAGLQVAWLCGFLLGTEFLVFLSRQFFRSFGVWVSEAAYRAGLVSAPPLANPSAMTKWLEQSWQLTVHVLFASIEYVLLFVAPRDQIGIPPMWELQDLPNVWTPLPWELGDKELHWLRLLCLAQVAVWMYTAGMHVFYDKRRKDYQVMLTHHVVTIGLLAGAMEKNYLRIALLVLYLNDATDVFIDTLKMANYAKLRGAKAMYIAEVAFLGVIGSMGYFRMYHEPIRVNYTTSIVAHKTATSLMDPQKKAAIGIDENTPLWNIFFQRNWSYHPNNENDYFELLNVLLLILFVLHLYWFLLMFKILFLVLTKDAQSASREEYEGDSDEEEDDDQGGKESYVFATTIRNLLLPHSNKKQL